MGEMQEKSDAQLLRDYAERGNEAAFREIVDRHADLIYSAALRQVNSAAAAGDIAQGVFVDLARKAQTAGDRQPANSSLAGWLFRSTRYAALNHLRDDRRRAANERQAMEQLLTNAETAPDWSRIRPVLDEALDGLSDEDREALLLRYFKNHDFRAVGLALGVSDDAAQKRVSRAVEQLRDFFAKRGITVGAGGLAVALSANAVQAAPAGLAAAISTAAVAGTTLAASAAAVATKTFVMTTMKTALVATAFAIVSGTGIYEARQNSLLRGQIETSRQQQVSLAAQTTELQNERDAAARKVDVAAEPKAVGDNSNELLRLRAEVTRLRNQANAGTQEADSAKAFRSTVMQVFSNAPPIRTYLANTSATVAWNESVLVGGWATPPGKRTYLLSTPQSADGGKSILIKSKIFAVPETAGKELGLEQFNVDGQTSNHAHALNPDQVAALLNAARASAGVELLTAPEVTTGSGRQAEIQVGDMHQTPSGESYFTGPVINLIPTISQDGKSVQLVIAVQINSPLLIPDE